MPPKDKIAVIAAAVRLPGAADLDTLWNNIVDGRTSISRFEPDPANPDYVPVHGTLDDYTTFDAELFGYSPREAELTDPQQRKFLECAFEALESAGYPGEPEGRSFGVVAGVGNNSYFVNNVLPHPELSSVWGETAMFVASEKDHVATRTAHRLDLTGPAIAIQTSCSTSLVAVHLACRALQAGDADLMVAGGSTIQVPHERGHVFSPHGVTSRDGECRPFDARASGTVFGSGVGVVVLKRLADAVADGDDILGVIAGSAINNDGARKVGYTAPSVPGQVDVIRRALDEAAVEPHQIGYVETHGTGTELGDAIEFEALREALGGSPDLPCVLGTLKPQLGHLDSAAGVAGLVKALMVVKTGVVPVNVNFEKPHPDLDMSATRFQMRTATGPWTPLSGPRYAGVSSFGLGGTNAHVVLEQPPETRRSEGDRQVLPVVLPVSAQTSESAEELMERVVARVAHEPLLNGAATTLQQRRRAFPHRVAVVAENGPEATERARLAVPRRVIRNPRLGLLFSGYGHQWPGMCAGLSRWSPTFASALDEALAALRAAGADVPSNGLDLDDRCWTEPLSGQPLLFAAHYALARVIEDVSGPSAVVLGHSMGEYAAACLAGGLDVDGAATLIVARAQLLATLSGGGMTSVLASEEELDGLLGPELVIAARNAPDSVVVSGGVSRLDTFEAAAAAAGLKTRRMDIEVAGHSPQLDPVLPEFRRRADTVAYRPLTRPLVSTMTGRTHAAGDVLDGEHWTRHLRAPVEFTRAIQQVGSTRGLVLTEIGAGQALSGLVRKIPTQHEIRLVASLPSAHEEIRPTTAVVGLFADLWTAGLPLSWERLGGDSASPPRVAMPTYPFARHHHWIEPPAHVEGAVGQQPVAPAGAPSQPSHNGSSATHGNRPDSGPDDSPTEVADVLASAWSGLLGAAAATPDTNFFAAGGDSLLLVRLIARIRTELGVSLPLRDAAQNATMTGLAALVTHIREDR